MSWMDSWSRPAKHTAIPPPLYLTEGEHVPYCHTCGRVMSIRKSQQRKGNEVKYCSDRCRNRKPGSMDRMIERRITDLLNGKPESGIDQTQAASKVVKGDKRLIVTCGEVEELVFGSRHDPAKTFGRRKNRASRAIGSNDEEWKSVDMVDSDHSSSEQEDLNQSKSLESNARPLVRPPQTQSEVNGSIGGEKGRAERNEESIQDIEKRRQGQQQAEQREMVRRAARRAVIFGLVVDPDVGAPSGNISSHHGKTSKSRRKNSDDIADGPVVRKCEAVMNGSIVEPSFAKGDWAIRWRE